MSYNLVDPDTAIHDSVAAGSAEHPDYHTGRDHRPEILADVASITRTDEMAVINHYNIRRVVDIYGLGAGSRPGRGWT